MATPTVHEHWEPVAPHTLDEALTYVREGGSLVLATVYQKTIINTKTLAAFDKAGDWLLREDGDGFRIHRGKRSEYIIAGYLRYLA